MKYLKLFPILILFEAQLIANDSIDIKINNYYEKIIVHGIDSGYTKYISIYGQCYKKALFIPTMIDQKNDSISNFSLYFKKKGKYKKVDEYKLMDSPSLYHFHDSRVIKIIELDSGKNFLCQFKIDCKNLILFNSIGFYSLYETDTANYQIIIPNKLSIKYDSLNFDSLSYFKISQSFNNDSQLLNFLVKPYKIELKNNYRKYPISRVIIVPKAKENKEEEFFNNWYLSSIEECSNLDTISKIILDSIANSNSSNKNLISVYYEFIKTQFKYLDVQVGMGAFIPRDVNLVLKNKQGDCKDLSNLLRVILNYKGYNANLAIAATNDYFCDFNFPSLSSGNHAICVVKIDSIILLLDPTVLQHKIGQPIQSLQGKTIFITDVNNPYYYKVPILAPNENNFNIFLNLDAKNNILEGSFKIVTTGYISDELQWISATYSNKELQQIIFSKVSEIFQNRSIDSIKKTIYNDSIVIEGKIKYFNKYYKSNSLIYLFLDYVPNLYSNYFHKNNITEETLIGSTLNKNLFMKVTFNEKIEDIEFSPLYEKNDTYLLKFDANKLNEKTLNINYSFVYNKIWINNTDIEIVNSLIENFNKKTHETIVLHY